jgi:hypothetical protein
VDAGPSADATSADALAFAAEIAQAADGVLTIDGETGPLADGSAPPPAEVQDGGAGRDLVREDSALQDLGSLPPPTLAKFPLTISTNNKHLVDAQGTPFLIRGDAAWSLVAELSRAEAIRYLDDRQSRGFNTLLVSLIEHKFTSHTPAWRNAEGDAPFADVQNFAAPNDAYFSHVDWLLKQAEIRGMLVLLCPAYLGYACGDEGWCQEMKTNGVDRLKKYGQYVGQRYRDFPNIVWVEGGDHTPSVGGSPSEMDLVNAVQNGIATGDGGKHLHTAHWSSETSGAEVAEASSWLDVDTTYTYTSPHVTVKAESDFARDDGKRPFFLIESAYENEHHASPLQLRAEMYQPVLSGGFGFVFGNFPMWSFWKPGAPPWQFDDGAYKGGWTTALDTPGAHNVSAFMQLMNAGPLQELCPDIGHKLITSGFGTPGSDATVLGASTPDGRLAVAYFTAKLVATVDISLMKGPISARWFDPALGTFVSVSGSPFANAGTQSFAPPGPNGDGSPDWVLVLKAE